MHDEFKFKSSDFESLVTFTEVGHARAEEIANKAALAANIVLEQWINSAPQVFSPTDDECWMEQIDANPNYPWEKRARLVCIEPFDAVSYKK